MRFLTFEAPAAELTEDSEQPVGRDLALHLARGVENEGFILQQPVDAHDSYGWAFVAGSPQQSVWCMLQRSDQWLVIAKPRVSLLKRLVGKGGDDEPYRRLCRSLDVAARSIPGVSDIRWFSEHEFLNQGEGTAAP